MKDSLNKIKINLDSPEWFKDLDYISLKKNWLEVHPLLKKTKIGLLIERKHQFIQSQLILNETSSCHILSFDKNQNHISTKIHIDTRTESPISYLIPDAFILIVPLNTDFSLKVPKKYKYLSYVPKPVKLDPAIYDLVDDEEFCNPDGRTPLLIVTQHGIFPTTKVYGNKPELDYSKLEGLENQKVGFIGRGYLSNRERDGIREYFLDSNTLKQIRSKIYPIDLRLWYKKP